MIRHIKPEERILEAIDEAGQWGESKSEFPSGLAELCAGLFKKKFLEEGVAGLKTMIKAGLEAGNGSNDDRVLKAIASRLQERTQMLLRIADGQEERENPPAAGRQ